MADRVQINFAHTLQRAPVSEHHLLQRGSGPAALSNFAVRIIMILMLGKLYSISDSSINIENGL